MCPYLDPFRSITTPYLLLGLLGSWLRSLFHWKLLKICMYYYIAIVFYVQTWKKWDIATFSNCCYYSKKQQQFGCKAIFFLDFKDAHKSLNKLVVKYVFSTFSRHNLCNLNVKFTSRIQVLPWKEAVFEEKKSWESDKNSSCSIQSFASFEIYSHF